MKKMKQLVLAGLSCALLAGCMSYRMCSHGEGGRVDANWRARGQYRIVGLQIDCNRGPASQMRGIDNPWAADPWSILQVATLLKDADVITAVRERTPGVCEDVNAVPIEIKVVSTMERKELEATVVAPYFVSLGTLPALTRCISDCKIEVSIGTGERRRTYNCNRDFVVDSKMTCFSPLGLIDYDQDPAAIEQQRSSSDVGSAITSLPIRASIRNVFAGTVAKYLAFAISLYEEGK